MHDALLQWQLQLTPHWFMPTGWSSAKLTGSCNRAPPGCSPHQLCSGPQVGGSQQLPGGDVPHGHMVATPARKQELRVGHGTGVGKAAVSGEQGSAARRPGREWWGAGCFLRVCQGARGHTSTQPCCSALGSWPCGRAAACMRHVCNRAYTLSCWPPPEEHTAQLINTMLLAPGRH
jgi:hypothetical protein